MIKQLLRMSQKGLSSNPALRKGRKKGEENCGQKVRMVKISQKKQRITLWQMTFLCLASEW